MTLTQIKPLGLSKPVDLADDEKIRLGTDNDLQIYYGPGGGGSSYIDVTGSLQIHTTELYINNEANTERLIRGVQNGAAELYYDGVKKFETTANGVLTTGNIQLDSDSGKLTVGDSGDFEIYHNGSHTYLDNLTGHLIIRNNVGNDENTNIYIKAKQDEDGIVINDDSSVELYHDNTKKFETTSSGVTISGGTVANGHITLPDHTGSQDAKLKFGASTDFEIFHNGSSNNTEVNHTTNTGHLQITGNRLKLMNYDGPETYIDCFSNGTVALYYDNAKKAETYSSGLIAHHHLKVMGGQDQNAVIQMFADEGDNTNDQFLMASDATVNRWVLQGQYVSGWHRYIQVLPQQGVQLYYDDLDSASPAAKFETLSDGARTTGLDKVRSADLNVTHVTRPLYLSIPTNTTKTITLTSLLGSAKFIAGGYANAGQGALALHILLGGAMFGTQHYNVNVLQNSAMQNVSTTLTKNGTSYVIAIQNSSNTYSLNLSMCLEHIGSTVGYAVS